MYKISRAVYLIASWLFLLGVLTQVFLAGMVVVAARMGWNNHRNFGHSLGIFLLIMLVSAYAGRLPRQMKGLTWLLFAVYIVQADVIIFLRSSAPVVSAFHPVLALIDFALIVVLTRRAWSLLKETEEIFPTRRATAGD